jgi:hypothetical protein
MNAYNHRGALKPPPEIWAEMEEAGRTGDHVRLGIARAAYRAWLTDQGYTAPRRGNTAPEGAWE